MAAYIKIKLNSIEMDPKITIRLILHAAHMLLLFAQCFETFKFLLRTRIKLHIVYSKLFHIVFVSVVFSKSAISDHTTHGATILNDFIHK